MEQQEIDVTFEFNEGAKANRQNKPRAANPFTRFFQRQAWFDGWDENNHCDDEG